MNIIPIINEAARAARAGLQGFGNVKGADEAAQAIKDFAARGAKIAGLLAFGGIDQATAAKIIDSEQEALKFNLAAIAQENKRAWLEQVLGAALKFVSALLLPTK